MKFFKKTTSFIAAVVLASSGSVQAFHKIDWLNTKDLKALKIMIEKRSTSFSGKCINPIDYFKYIISQFEYKMRVDHTSVNLWAGIRLYFNLVASYVINPENKEEFFEKSLPEILNRWHNEDPFALYSLIVFLQTFNYDRTPLNAYFDLTYDNELIIEAARRKLSENVRPYICKFFIQDLWRNKEQLVVDLGINQHTIMKIFPPNFPGINAFHRQVAVLQKLNEMHYEYFAGFEVQQAPIIKVKRSSQLMSIENYIKTNDIQHNSKEAVELTISLWKAIYSLHECGVVLNCKGKIEDIILINKDGNPEIFDFSNSYLSERDTYLDYKDIDKLLDIIYEYLIPRESRIWEEHNDILSFRCDPTLFQECEALREAYDNLVNNRTRTEPSESPSASEASDSVDSLG